MPRLSTCLDLHRLEQPRFSNREPSCHTELQQQKAPSAKPSCCQPACLGSPRLAWRLPLAGWFGHPSWQGRLYVELCVHTLTFSQTCLSNGSGSAFKRRVRAKESQKTLNGPSQRPQQKVKTSHKHFPITTTTPSKFSKQWQNMKGTSKANIINVSCTSCGIRPRLRRGLDHVPN